MDGQLGDGTTSSSYDTTVTVLDITTAKSIDLGSSHSCAVLTDGKVKCWGDNYYGQLGDGTTTDRSTPVEVSGITSATSVVLGDDHSCAVLTDETVKCWGDNSAGELGDGTETDRATPVDVTTAYNTTATASGANTAAPAIVVISALVGALAIFA
jgi:alpha-tubulin suppressor-like RCC1 family protein